MVKSPEFRRMNSTERLAMSHSYRTVAATALACALFAGCTPTIRVEVAPINIYAKLDADVRVRLDREVQSAIAQNPDLF
jgi:hypothetical protein